MPPLAQLNTYKRGTVQAQGHTLALMAGNVSASGTPVILLHGITGMPIYAALTLNTPALAQHPWYAISLPGHSTSTYPDGFGEDDLTPQHLGEVMSDAVRQCTSGKPAIIIGHSTGGTVALLIAAHAPDLVAGAISVSGFVIGRWGSSLGLSQQFAALGPLGKVLFALLFLPMQTPFMAQYAALSERLWSGDWAGHQADAYNAEIQPQIVAELGQTRMAHLWPWFRKMPHTDITPYLSQIQAPVLAIAGDKDPVVPPEHARIIAEKTNGTLTMLAGVGHLPMRERRHEYAQAVDTWLQAQGMVGTAQIAGL